MLLFVAVLRHRFCRIGGIARLKPRVPDQNRHSSWSFLDSCTAEFARRVALTKRQAGKPCLLFQDSGAAPARGYVSAEASTHLYVNERLVRAMVAPLTAYFRSRAELEATLAVQSSALLNLPSRVCCRRAIYMTKRLPHLGASWIPSCCLH
jgi:hypothetical protein